MFSNIFIKNDDTNTKINLKDKQKVNLFLITNANKNIEKNINLTLKNGNLVNIYCLILSNNKTQNININVNHIGNNSQSNIFVKTLANNKSLVQIFCTTTCNGKTKNNLLNQTIDSLMFDNDSIIKALPCLDANTNDVVGTHTASLGQVNPEIIFYLNTKGLSTMSAYKFLITNFINIFDLYIKKYNLNIDKEIKLMLGDNYE